jgi:hypothetical protein
MRDHERDLRNIRRDADREEEDNLLEQDFKAIFLAKRTEQRKLDDAQQAFEDEASERTIAHELSLRDLAQQGEREREQRRRDFAAALKEQAIAEDQQRRDARIGAQRQLDEARRAQQAQLKMLQQRFQKEMALYQAIGSAAASALQAALRSGGRSRTVNNSSRNVQNTFNINGARSPGMTANAVMGLMARNG